MWNCWKGEAAYFEDVCWHLPAVPCALPSLSLLHFLAPAQPATPLHGSSKTASPPCHLTWTTEWMEKGRKAWALLRMLRTVRVTKAFSASMAFSSATRVWTANTTSATWVGDTGGDIELLNVARKGRPAVVSQGVLVATPAMWEWVPLHPDLPPNSSTDERSCVHVTPVLRIRNSWFQALGDTTVFHLGGICVVLDMGGTC